MNNMTNTALQVTDFNFYAASPKKIGISKNKHYTQNEK